MTVFKSNIARTFELKIYTEATLYIPTTAVNNLFYCAIIPVVMFGLSEVESCFGNNSSYIRLPKGFFLMLSHAIYACAMCAVPTCTSQVSGMTCRNGVKAWLLKRAEQFFPAKAA